MLVCAGACVCVLLWVCVLRIVSRDKILHFTNTCIIIVVIIITVHHLWAHTISTHDFTSKQEKDSNNTKYSRWCLCVCPYLEMPVLNFVQLSILQQTDWEAGHKGGVTEVQVFQLCTSLQWVQDESSPFHQNVAAFLSLLSRLGCNEHTPNKRKERRTNTIFFLINSILSWAGICELTCYYCIYPIRLLQQTVLVTNFRSCINKFE